MPPEIHTVQKFYFLKPVIHFKQFNCLLSAICHQIDAEYIEQKNRDQNYNVQFLKHW